MIVNEYSPQIAFETMRIGGFVKVIAIDLNTGEEATILGSTAAPDIYLQKLARQKLLLNQQKKL